MKLNYKNTRPRQLILTVLSKYHQPLSAQEIYNLIKADKINLVSIYRNLKKFEQDKIVEGQIIAKEKKYFLAEKHHHHIVCQKCQQTACLPCNYKKPTAKNWQIINHHITLNGLCPKCH